jgi:hypothetical protein
VSAGERESPRPDKPEGTDATGITSTAILERCEHAYQRPTTDGDLAICSGCGRICGALTTDGKVELLCLSLRWSSGLGEVGETGGDDYAIRVPGATPAPSRNGHEKPARWGAVAV